MAALKVDNVLKYLFKCDFKFPFFFQGERVHLCGDEGGVAGVRAGLLQADLPARHPLRQPRRRRHRPRNQPGGKIISKIAENMNSIDH